VISVAIDVFNRHENKYLVDPRQYEALLAGFAGNTVLDPYNIDHPTYTITNIYYDTTDNDLIRTSLQKPRYKEKLRLRAYGVPGPDDRVYVEIKKKVSGVVNKRRSAMRLTDAYEFLATGRLPDQQPMHNRQVLNEIAYILQQHDLKPSLHLAYDRRAYFGQADPELRISFDSAIRSRRTGLRLEAGDHGDPLLPEGTWLMEIKTAANLPTWLARLLSEQQVFPVSFSKYGFEYQQRLSAVLRGKAI
jgi:hypothetical protein